MRSNHGIFWYSLGLTLLLLLPMVLTVAFFTDQYQKQQLLRQASAADSTLHIEPGAQGVYTLLLVVQQEEPAFVLARADGPQQTVTLCALPGSLRVSAPSGTTTLAGGARAALKSRLYISFRITQTNNFYFLYISISMIFSIAINMCKICTC